MSDSAFLEAVAQEAQRARDLFPGQETDIDPHGWLAILTEEVGEVAHELNEFMLDPDNYEHGNLPTELVQVGAMALLMCSAVKKQWQGEDMIG